MDELEYRTVFVDFFLVVFFFLVVVFVVLARCFVGVRFFCAGSETVKANAKSIIK